MRVLTQSPNRLNLAASLVAGILVIGGCAHRVDVQPIKVEPIHLTVDVNIKVDRELDRFFDYEDEPAPPVAPAPTTRPAGVGLMPATESPGVDEGDA